MPTPLSFVLLSYCVHVWLYSGTSLQLPTLESKFRKRHHYYVFMPTPLSFVLFAVFMSCMTTLYCNAAWGDAQYCSRKTIPPHYTIGSHAVTPTQITFSRVRLHNLGHSSSNTALNSLFVHVYTLWCGVSWHKNSILLNQGTPGPASLKLQVCLLWDNLCEKRPENGHPELGLWWDQMKLTTYTAFSQEHKGHLLHWKL